MIRMVAATITAFFLLAPLSATADEGDFHPASGDVDFGNVEDFRWRASALEGQRRELEYRQQWVVSELIDTYYKLAETQAALADSTKSGDRNRRKLLEKQFHILTVEEARLWREFERLND